MTTSPSTWLITGPSSGLGRSLALTALEAGYKVIGTTRDVSKAETACPEFSARGGIWIGLDPAQKDSYDQFAKCAQEHNVDVLVNNAGYAFIGGVEDTKFIARPGRGTYSASKFAIEAIHESLSHEVKTLGIKVLIVEPGAFRTPFASRILTPTHIENGFSEGYKGTMLEQMVTGSRNITSIPDFFKGDPDKAARAIIKAASTGYDYLRLPLGTDCVVALEDKIWQLQRDLDATWAIATATDVY